MRTNIELDDALMDEAGKYARSRTKRGIVKEALATYVALKTEELRRRTYKDRLEKVRTKAAKVRLSSDTRDVVRQDRDRT